MILIDFIDSPNFRGREKCQKKQQQQRTSHTTEMISLSVLRHDCARGRHCTVSAAASRRHVDASLDLFTRKSPRIWRDLSEKKADAGAKGKISKKEPLFKPPVHTHLAWGWNPGDYVE